MLVLVATLKIVDIAYAVTPINPNMGYVKNIGQKLFTDYLLPFEVASILFLSAMIGVVLISKKEKTDDIAN
jgi:NADH-quinone oxidoreductase subunit J